MLITLGIIGVVAAMTLPAVISSYNKVVIETRLIKFYSTINNAIALSEIDNGKVENWEFLPSDAHKREAWFKKYILPYLRHKKYELKLNPNANDGSIIHFYDGSFLAVWKHPVDWHYYVTTKTTKDGISHFFFQFDPYNLWGEGTNYAHKKPVTTYKFGWDGTHEQLVNDCKEKGTYCAALIEQNGWKIPDDYPVKL